jgi:NAD(P)-dependent dehydrogenase (short-subunit alcohol dehydrogenase family)
VIIVLTGASSGIGRAAAHALAEQGHELAIVGRNPFRTNEVARETGGTAFLADFDKLEDVRALVRELLGRYPHIDALGNNAGGLVAARGLSKDGVESTWQHNVLAPFVLTGFPAYGAAKRADAMIARELARREPTLHVSSYHPGGVATGFAGLNESPFAGLVQRVLRTPEQGAAQQVGLLTGDLDAASGSYVDGDKRDRGLAAQARDPEACRALWDALEAQAARLAG